MAADTWAPEGSAQHSASTAAAGGLTAGGSPLPAPPLQTRKKPKGCELSLEDANQTLLAWKLLHMLKKQGSEMGQC